MADVNIRAWTEKFSSDGRYPHIVEGYVGCRKVFERVLTGLDIACGIVEGLQAGLMLCGKTVSVEGKFFNIREDSGAEYAWHSYLKDTLEPLRTKWKSETKA